MNAWAVKIAKAGAPSYPPSTEHRLESVAPHKPDPNTQPHAPSSAKNYPLYALEALPFLLLVHLCDRDRQLAVHTINELRSGCQKLRFHSEFVPLWITHCQRDYVALWSAYAAQRWTLENKKLWALILEIHSNKVLEPKSHAIAADLGVLAEHFLRSQFRKLSNYAPALDEMLGLIAGKVVLENAARLPQAAPAQPPATPAALMPQPGLAQPSPAPVKNNAVPQELALPALYQTQPLQVIQQQSHFWRGGHLQLLCRQVRNETHDVKTFSFVASDMPTYFAYHPGQAATLELLIDGKTVRRSYTISSSPSRPYMLEFTIKRVPGGLVSNWMHDHMAPGHAIYVTGPHGKFNCTEIVAPRYLMLSAGSGITPTMAMTRWLADTAAQADIVFLHYARSPQDLIFEAELQALAAQKKIQLVNVCADRGAQNQWQGPTGFISAQQLHDLVPDAAQRAVMMCGPKGFMDKARSELLAAGCAAENIHSENFSPPVVESEAKPGGKVFTLKLEISGKTVPAQENLLLLDSLLNAGVDTPHACRAGSCGSCKVQVHAGEVEMPDNCSGLSSAERELGYVLACSCRVTGDLTLEM